MSVPIMAVLATCAFQGDYDPVWINKAGSETYDQLYAATSDSVGGAYVVGTTLGEFPGPIIGFSDGIVRRVNARGQTLWGVQLGTFGTDSLRCVSADAAGNVFVGGSSFDFSTSLLNEALVARLDSAGNIDWQIDTGSSGTDNVDAVLPDGSGGCIAIGNTTGSFGGPNAGSFDIFVLRINAAGVQTGVTQFGTVLGEGRPKAVSDGAGGYFLSFPTAGSYAAPNGGLNDVVLARFDAADNQLWARQYGSSADDAVWDLSSDGAGGVYVCGTTNGGLAGPHFGVKDIVVGRFDGAGNELFLQQEGDAGYNNGHAVAWDAASNRLYTAGSHSYGTPIEDESDGFLRVYTDAGVLLQEQLFGGAGIDVAYDVLANGMGGALVAGVTHGEYGGPGEGQSDVFVTRYEEVIGTAVCSPAVPNSTNESSEIRALGSLGALNGNLTLQVTLLPKNVTGYFLTSMTPALVPMAGGSLGTLCLGGSVGRYVGPGQVQESGTNGAFGLVLDLTQMPTPLGFVPAAAGQIWYFQAWHRDTVGGPVTNFTDAVSVMFQ